MNKNYIYILLFFGIIYLIDFIRKKRKLKKVSLAYESFLDYLEKYELEVNKAFNQYLLSKKVFYYDFSKEEVEVIKSKKFLNANIDSAFDKIKIRLVKKVDEELYEFGNRKKINTFYVDKFLNYFPTSSEKTKLEFVNEEFEEFATQVAIENSTTTNNQVGLGAEFIALWVYNNKSLYHIIYPERTLLNLERGIEQRNQNPNQELKEFWSDFEFAN